MKAAPIALLAALALAATGCDQIAPRPQTPQQAFETYHGRLAETCADKHRESLTPDQFNHLASDFYHDLDLNGRQSVDKFTTRSCAATGAHLPDCNNDGFLSSIQNIGEMDHFTIFVCAHGSEAEANPTQSSGS